MTSKSYYYINIRQSLCEVLKIYLSSVIMGSAHKLCKP